MKKIIYFIILLSLISCMDANENKIIETGNKLISLLLPIVIVPQDESFKKLPHNFYYHSSNLDPERFLLSADTIPERERKTMVVRCEYTNTVFHGAR